MEFLGSGIDRQCNPKAGIQTLKIAAWKKDLQYIKEGNELIEIEPLTTYTFEVPKINYSVNVEHDDTGESYSINVDAEISKVSKENALLFRSISELQLIAILKDEYNNEVVLGLENGLTPKITETSGGAKNTFSGYTLNLQGNEEQQPLFSTLFEPRLNSVLTINEDVLIINDKVLQV